MKFQVYRDASGKFRFRLRANNNQIVATGEGYETKASCLNGIGSIKKNCDAKIEDLTVVEEGTVPNPKFQVYQDAKEKFRFRLRAANGEIIAEGQGYEEKEGCLHGIEVIGGCASAEIEDLSANQNVPEETAPVAEVAPVIAAPIIAEPKMEPPAAEVAEIPTSNGPVETNIEFYAAPANITKGNKVAFQGKLSAASSGKGIGGAKIRIYEHDKSILGDDYLAFGKTNKDGTFDITWRARPLTWRKKTGNIYAKFRGNDSAKSSQSSIQQIEIG